MAVKLGTHYTRVHGPCPRSVSTGRGHGYCVPSL